MAQIKSTAVLLAFVALTIACGQASPTSPSGTVLAAPIASASLFGTAGAPFGALILSGTATTAHVGEYTTITVRLDPSVASMRWDFGDGTTSALSRGIIQHYYQTAGTYHATLTVTTFSGQSETAEGNIDVLPAIGPPAPTPPPNPPPGSVFGVSVNASVATLGTPTTFTITLSGAAASDVTSAAIAFGDGSETAITSATLTHQYAASGNYGVIVTVTDTLGRARQATTLATVRPAAPLPGPPELILYVIVNAAPATQPTTILIASSAVDTPLPTFYEVDCTNDGTYDVSSPGNAMQCVYPVAGTYTARVRATNGILTSTATSDPFVVQP